VALVPQLSFAFDDTVRVNVGLGRDGIDDERIWQALRLAQAEDFVAKLPDGLDTVLGERGVVLSGGQHECQSTGRPYFFGRTASRDQSYCDSHSCCIAAAFCG
jgi:ABC-type transport system involved in Fe-S cluster assembly fused permease/ATPase subunit